MEFILSSEAEAPASGYWQALYLEIYPRLLLLEDNDYGEELNSIAIISIILKEHHFDDGGFPERKYFSHIRKEADIRLRINFNEFVKSKPQKRREIYVNHIIESLMVLKPRLSKNFRFEDLITDVQNVLKG